MQKEQEYNGNIGQRFEKWCCGTARWHKRSERNDTDEPEEEWIYTRK